MSERELTHSNARRAQTRLLPTLLDRLVDNAPHQQTESPDAYAVSPSQMREIVQRDLSWLLNTTSLEDEIDREAMPWVASSVLNYGVPAFAGRFVAERNWQEVERIVRRAVMAFEPRLLPETLEVVPMVDEHASSHNVLRFEIRGLVHMQPYPMEFLVQSSLDLETSRLSFL